VGTGLGLSICRGILADFQGELSITSQVGRGTRARVSLPVGKLGGQKPAPPAPAVPVAGRRARVLVIDDEPVLVRLFTRALEVQHDVTGVTLARDALKRISEGQRYDLILCDLMMPEMTGMELYMQLSKLAPEQAERMVFLTGGIFTARTRQFLQQIPNQRLEKPLAPSRLLALVGELVK
jgi:CheY-like chemotaxis protein